MNDTIAAVATPAGEAGLAVVRISGPDAAGVADRCFRKAGPAGFTVAQAPTHTVHYGHLMRGGQVVDEVLLTWLRAPRTFTREDTVEVSCHGGALTTRLVLEAVVENGARLAEPGEFTRRAFLNGRLDLAQAEAVADLIHSRSELSLAAAQGQLEGRLSRRTETLRESLMRVLAHVEAHIDFPDEDIDPDTGEGLCDRLREVGAEMGALLETAREGRILRQGIRVVVAGRPNAGKSSLLNALVGRDRAIVTPRPGTTRDTVEEVVNIRGIPVCLVDTAGLREAEDEIEAEGVRRSRQALRAAELVLHVVDGAEGRGGPEDLENQTGGGAVVIVYNKADLVPDPDRRADSDPDGVWVSCLTGVGLEELRDRIQDRVWSGPGVGSGEAVWINTRHQGALRRASEALSRALRGLESGLDPELVAVDLRLAAGAVGEITGKTATEDLLDVIFGEFCLGK